MECQVSVQKVDFTMRCPQYINQNFEVIDRESLYEIFHAKIVRGRLSPTICFVLSATLLHASVIRILPVVRKNIL